MIKPAESDLSFKKEANAFFEQFDRKEDKVETYHAAAHRPVDWLLAENEDGIVPEALLKGLDQLQVNQQITFLIPHQVPEALSLAEFHQIIRELVTGIYVFNQLPLLKFEPNFDGTTSCFIPSAYTNTLVGQTMLSIGFFIESLLHDSTVPKEKHQAVNESWRSMSVKTDPVKLLQEGGMVPLTEDLDLGPDLYKDPEPYFPRHPAFGVDCKLADQDLGHLATTEELFSAEKERSSTKLFQKHLSQARLFLILAPLNIAQHKSLFVLDTSWDIQTAFPDIEGELTPEQNGEIQSFLQKQRDFIRSRLTRKRDTMHELDLLQFISASIPLLVSLKKQHRVISQKGLLPGPSKERLHTEKDIPPLLPSENSRWTASDGRWAYLHSGVGFYKQRQPVDSVSDQVRDQYSSIIKQAEACNFGKEEDYTINSIITVDNKKYCLLMLNVEEFYPKSPKLPRWLHAMMDQLKIISKQPPLTDFRIQEFLHKVYGPKKAYKMKSTTLAIQACVESGLVAPAAALLKRCTITRLNKPSENGICLVHLAAIRGRDIVLSQIIKAGADKSLTCMYSPSDDKPKQTGLVHLAARSGETDTVLCLIQAGCPIAELDERGWLPLHYAAYHNHHFVVRLLLNHLSGKIDCPTADDKKMAPLLLAVEAGALDTVQLLIQRGADLTVKTGKGLNLVTVASIHNHTNILLHLMKLPDLEQVFWQTLHDMLQVKGNAPITEAATRVLDPLSRYSPEQHLFFLKFNLIPTLVKLLGANEEIQILAIQVLRNICNYEAIAVEILKAGMISFIPKLLSSESNQIQSHACLLVCDLVTSPELQMQFCDGGVMAPLSALLQSTTIDVVLYSCAAIGILVRDNPKAQSLAADEDCIPHIVGLLSSDYPSISACSAHVLSVLVYLHPQNQLLAMQGRAKHHLADLLKHANTSIHCNAALAIKAMAFRNLQCQKHFISDDKCINGLVKLLKIVDRNVKVCGASALWAIGEQSLADKRYIAIQMDISCLVDTLGLGSEELDYICGEALGSLASEMGEHQLAIIQVGGIIPLFHILRRPASDRVILCTLRCIAALAVKPALIPISEVQKITKSVRGIGLLIQVMSAKNTDLVRAQGASTLAKLCLGSPEMRHEVFTDPDFNFRMVFDFVTSEDQEVCLAGGEAISVFVYNNPDTLQHYMKLGRIEFSHYQPLLVSEELPLRVSAAFQITVLAKLFKGISSGQACIKGIKILVHLTQCSEEEIQILACEFLGRLAHSYDGLPQVIVGAGGVEALFACLNSDNPPLIQAASVVIGYLSYNHTARRLILSQFRSSPDTFDLFYDSLFYKHVCPVFLGMWKDTLREGLPTVRLVCT